MSNADFTKKIEFSKYQGLGNDFILIDDRYNQSFENLSNSDKKIFSKLCDRNFGIGADGVIIALDSSQNADVRMRIINSDATEAEMCGNGIRCLVKFLIERDKLDLSLSKSFKIETLAGCIYADFEKDNQISVDMGTPKLNPSDIPTTMPMSTQGIPKSYLEYKGLNIEIFAVGMGNPHLITYNDKLEDFNYSEIGSFLETNSLFPNNTNVHFAKVINRSNIELKVWERGCGLTLACGTGACATLVASSILGLTDNKANVRLPGGNLIISWPNINSSVFMKGPAKHIFTGQFDINNFKL